MKAMRPVLEIFKMAGYFSGQLTYSTIILPVLYACETWLLTLREERKLRLFENRVLRRIFGRRRVEVIGDSRKPNNGEVNDLYSTNIFRVIESRRIRWAGHVARMGERRGAYRVWVRKPEGKRPLGRPRCRWEDNIKADYQELKCGGMDWRALVNAVMKCGEFLDWLKTSYPL
jgi:hypothetical protein